MVEKYINETITYNDLDNYHDLDEPEHCSDCRELPTVIYSITHTYYNKSSQSYINYYLCKDCYSDELTDLKKRYNR